MLDGVAKILVYYYALKKVVDHACPIAHSSPVCLLMNLRHNQSTHRIRTLVERNSYAYIDINIMVIKGIMRYDFVTIKRIEYTYVKFHS